MWNDELMTITNGIALRPCPHCGDDPDVAVVGTCIYIECCAAMSMQKSDMLTIDERKTWNDDTFLYSPEAEDKVLNIAAALWNKRQ